METMDGQEIAMRVRLADLQRRYKEKQRELAKLQRKHDHQKEETSRSPARRGPGRPRKRKSTPGTGPLAPAEIPKRSSSLGAGLGLFGEEARGGGETQRKKKKLSNRTYNQLDSTQGQTVKQSGRQGVLSPKLARKVSQAKTKRGVQQAGAFRRTESVSSSSAPQRLCRAQGPPKAELKTCGESGGQSDTAASADGVSQEGRRGAAMAALRRTPTRQQTRAPALHTGNSRAGKLEAEEKDTSLTESESSGQEEEEEGSYDSEEGQDDIKAPMSKDPSPGSAIVGPSPSSVVKLEANQKAKNKKERQEHLGSLSLPGADGEVKVKKKATCRLGTVTAGKQRQETRDPEGARRALGPKPPQQRGKLGVGSYRRSSLGFSTLASPGERLRKATRKNTPLQGLMSKRRSYWPGVTQSCQDEDVDRARRNRNKQPKGRAVSRLLESFAADEGFQMDEDCSFSEGEEDGGAPEGLLQSHRGPHQAVPSCVLTKELLVDGLNVLISKEDELLYSAYVHTLDLPDIYSIVIEGERGNRPRIYSLEQLLQEAVLEVRPETEAVLTAGTRVCAYWSERSRCMYPGYVRRGSPGEEEKEGSVMVEFDDGDRGWISLANIRLLPPDYQIHCAEPSPALLVSRGRRCRRSCTMLEISALNDTSCERADSAEAARAQDRNGINKAKPGKPKSANSGTKSPVSDNASKSTAPLLSWPAVAVPRKRPVHNFFQFNGTPKKTLKGKDTEMVPLLSAPAATPAKGIFSSSFEVDSFSSIANGYSSFGSQPTVMPLSPRSTSCTRGKRPGEGGAVRGRRAGSAEFLVKLDHEGVTSPKTKNGKALLLLGGPGHGGRMDKEFGTKCVGDMSSPMGYSHPVLLVKDNKKSGGTRAELLLKGASHLRKPSPALSMGEYSEFGMNCLSECHGFYSDMEDEEEEEESRAALAAASGGLRTAGRFLSRLSVSSSSSGSSSSSSSGSLSSSSLCSSDNDSSYSSEDEEGSALLLQGCISSHHALLQPPSQRSFVAKAMAVTSSKGGSNGNSANSKPLRRKDCPSSPSSISASKNPKDLAKRQRLTSLDTLPKMSPFLPARQLWRWSGNPTQRRGMKGKARKLFYKAIVRGRDTVRVGDCAVFLSAGRPNLPYIGRIESFWESWASNMVVKVKWFYHPEETKLGKRHRDGKNALYQSSHEDENDVQTISHKCQVVSREEYEQLSCGRRQGSGGQDLYYLAGSYDPTSGQLVTAEGVSILC